jgi:DNA-binding SARP family transcriptional activator
MLRLTTFGGLSIDGAEQPLTGAAIQRRRLALLAVAAAAGPQGISRDKLIGLFWSEVPEDRARHALAQALYALRRALGVEELFLGAPAIRLNTDVVSADCLEFKQALAAGERERAIALYAGPFLDGVYLDDTPGFATWAEGERDRFARAYADVLESSASDAEARGDLAGAVGLWRKLVAADPLAARPALGLMGALVAAGDPAAAVRHARVHEEMVRSELEVSPSPEVAAFAQRLRSDLPPAPRPEPLQKPATSVVNDSADLIDRPDTSAHFHTRSPRRHPRLMLALVGSAAFLAVLAMLASLAPMTGTAAMATDRDSNLVAVFPFHVRGDSTSDLREGMVDLLSAALDGAGDLKVVEPRAMLSRVSRTDEWSGDPARAASIAASFGSGVFILGDVTPLGPNIQVGATLYDAMKPDVPIARASESGATEETLDIVDRIAATLLARRLSKPGERLARVAAVTTSSLPALKAYLAGERELRARRYAAAGDAFRAAVAHDTTFALAFYRLSIAADWMGNQPLADSAAALAQRYAHRLSLYDRALVEAALAWRRLDFDEAERRYKAILLHSPNDVETWYQLGEMYFHNNTARGLPFLDARVPFERALALEPNNKDALLHLMRIASWEQRWDTLATILERVDPAKEDAALSPYRALAARDEGALERAVATIGVFDVHALYTNVYRLAVYTRRLDIAERAALPLTSTERPARERAVGFRALAHLSATQGKWRASRAYADSLQRLAPHFGLDTRARLATLSAFPYTRTELLSLRDSLLRWRGVPPDSTELLGYGRFAAREYALRLTALAGLLSARANDIEGVRAAAGALKSDRTPGPREWQQYKRDRGAMLQAVLLRADGRPGSGVAALMPVRPPDGWGSRGEERMLAAELYRDSGRLEDAVRWFASFEHMGVEDLPWAAPAHFARGELLERLGRNADAAADYERVAELWRDSDEESRPTLLQARQRAARLRSTR